jgi:hypothetical protein
MKNAQIADMPKKHKYLWTLKSTDMLVSQVSGQGKFWLLL